MKYAKNDPSIFVLMIACASVGWSAQSAPLDESERDSPDHKCRGQQGASRRLQATVTYYRGYEKTLFVQDGDAAIYIGYPNDLKLVPGDRVLIKGRTQISFNPIVLADSIKLLGRVALPKAVPATFDQMIRAETDCKLVTVRGVIRTADLSLSLVAPVHFMRLQLLMEGGYFDANVDSDDVGVLESLLDAEVELTGIASEEFDSKMHQTGILIHVQSLSDVKYHQARRLQSMGSSRHPDGSGDHGISSVAIPLPGSGFMEPSPITCPVQLLCCRTAPRASGSQPRLTTLCG